MQSETLQGPVLQHPRWPCTGCKNAHDACGFRCGIFCFKSANRVISITLRNLPLSYRDFSEDIHIQIKSALKVSFVEFSRSFPENLGGGGGGGHGSSSPPPPPPPPHFGTEPTLTTKLVGIHRNYSVHEIHVICTMGQIRLSLYAHQ